ncbi:class I SAM-dependent methyltransferase [Changpingibacter yushuensis]|uniref:class I SAM-dependent methyltransferase n=1 Tax=Changpingibacter yushuensis TaxID=2758440 RepID=UPI0015F6EA19|nr:class I SAM-dependent methyltransferase [Changpingibacter yushuensis]
MNPPVLDPCCGSRMMWFDKSDDRAIFGDIRDEQVRIDDGRVLSVHPDMVMDFRHLPFEDESFYHVVFDPPHLTNLGARSTMAAKYGVLGRTWRDDLKAGFSECFRVVKPCGTLVFKWNEYAIPVRDVLALTPHRPLYGTRSGKQARTLWLVFIKDANE